MQRRPLATSLPALPRRLRPTGTRLPRLDAARWLIGAGALVLTLVGPLRAAQASHAVTLPPPSQIQLTPSLSSPRPLDTQITWTATATDSVPLVYRFSVATKLAGPYTVVRDFSPRNSFVWAPLQEGTYYVAVTLQEGYTSTAHSATVRAFTLTSRVVGGHAVVSRTANPLVALYSAPACSRGYELVRFRQLGSQSWANTNAQLCQSGLSRNFLVAGMLATSTYQLVHLTIGASGVVTSTSSFFTTGAPPAAVIFPTSSVPQGVGAGTDTLDNLIVHLLVPSASSSDANPLATDLQGRLVWYANQADLSQVWPLRVQQVGGPYGSTTFLVGNDGQQQNVDNVLRQIDFAGNPLRETSIQAVNQQLAARGQEPIYGFHHDALILPNGDVATLGFTQQVITTTPVLGDMLIVLDKNMQVAWTWDAFQHLDPNRGPTLGDTCAPPIPPVLCPVPGGASTIDWTHANGLEYSAADKDLLISLRDQDWILKLNYNGGAGDGSTVWTLGPQGDFTLVPLNPADPFPWFSHQHDPNYVTGNTLELFDNGNTRCNGAAPGTCHSRGQVYVVDEAHKVVTQTVNLDTGTYSQALGTAQRLANGDYNFGSGFQFPPPPFAQEIELAPNGTKTYVQQIGNTEFRGWRLAGMDGAINPLCPSCLGAGQ